MLEITTPVGRLRVLAAVAEAEAAGGGSNLAAAGGGSNLAAAGGGSNLAAAGHLDRAFASVDRVLAERQALTDPADRVRVALWVAGTLGRLGRIDRVIGLARSIGSRHRRISTLAVLATALDRAGRPGRAVAILDAERTADLDHSCRARLFTALLSIREWQRADEVVRDASAREQLSLRVLLIEALIDAGEHDQALGMALTSVRDAGTRGALVARVAAAVAAADDPERALALAHDRIVFPSARNTALRAAARALHRAGRSDRAAEVLGLAIRAARAISDPRNVTSEVCANGVALAEIGHPEAGLAAIRSVATTDTLSFALVRLATALTAAGRFADAVEVLQTAPILTAEPVDQWSSDPLPSVVAAMVAAGRPDRAVAIADGVPRFGRRQQVRRRVAAALFEAGDPAGAGEVLDRIEADLPADDADQRAPTAHAWLRIGRPDRAAPLLVDALEYIATDIEYDDGERDLWCTVIDGLAAAGRPDLAAAEVAARASAGTTGLPAVLVNALTKAGLLDRAESVALDITDPAERARPLHEVAIARVKTGDLDRAETLVEAIADLGMRADALIATARATIAAGHREAALILLRRTESIAREIGDGATRDHRLGQVTEAIIAATGLGPAAELLAEAAGAAEDRPDLLVEVHCAAGRLAEAVRSAHDIAEPLGRCRALARVAEAVGTDADRIAAIGATSTVQHAAAVALLVTEPAGRAAAAAHLARAWMAVDRRDRAEQAVKRAVDEAGPEPPAPVAAELARAHVAVGDHVAAAALAADAGPAVTAAAIAAIATAFAQADEIDRALTAIRSVGDPDLAEEALVEVAVALARSRNQAGALALLRPIVDE